MKTLFKKILVLAVMFGTYTSYATDALKVSTTLNSAKKGSLLSITDASGEVIYSGNLTTLFDFSQLRDGNYTIEVNKNFEIDINSIIVKNHVVTFIEDSAEKIFKPVFRTEDSMVLISKIALDTKEMQVELYYENELIHSETVKGHEILNRVYRLDETFKGEYTAIVKSNERVFIENFRI
jgi:hypothetical protein